MQRRKKTPEPKGTLEAVEETPEAPKKKAASAEVTLRKRFTAKSPGKPDEVSFRDMTKTAHGWEEYFKEFPSERGAWVKPE